MTETYKILTKLYKRVAPGIMPDITTGGYDFKLNENKI